MSMNSGLSLDLWQIVDHSHSSLCRVHTVPNFADQDFTMNPKIHGLFLKQNCSLFPI